MRDTELIQIQDMKIEYYSKWLDYSKGDLMLIKRFSKMMLSQMIVEEEARQVRQAV